MNDRELLELYIRLRGSLDDRLVFHWLRARRYAVSGDEMIPLCNVLAGIVSNYTLQPDGTYQMTVYEITFYTDLETGEVLRSLKMPFSQKDVSPPLYRMGPEKYFGKLTVEESGSWTPQAFGEDHEDIASQMAPAGTFNFRFDISPAAYRGEDVWLRSDYIYQLMPIEADDSAKFYRESVVWHARQEDIGDGPTAPATYSYAAATTWRPWMEMGDIPGHTLSDGIGGKVWAARDLPEDFLALVDTHHPGILDDPASLLS